MDNITKTLKKLSKITDGLTKYSDDLLEIQKQTHYTDMEFIIVQIKIKEVAEEILKITEKILKKSEKND